MEEVRYLRKKMTLEASLSGALVERLEEFISAYGFADTDERK
jgi:hypothetical protein